jgi:hypothetical protein
LTETIFAPTTAATRPERFPEQLVFAEDRAVVIAVLIVLLLAGFAFRVYQLGAESLGEDEFNKLQTVSEYRHNGLSSKNGEHPFLMKGMQAVSIVASEKLNAAAGTRITEEGALRFPIALFGTFTALLLFFLVKELFGASIGLVTAALWSLEPLAISFDRVAKEDSLVLYFFLLAALLWVKGQTAAELGKPKWLKWVWASAAGFGALMASKYYLNLLTVAVAYYHSFSRLPGKKWSLGKSRWLRFLIIMGVTLLILNPTLLLPDTWREMVKFSSEGRVGHDSYEYFGVLYPHKFTDWLGGVPWTFYYVLGAVKTSLTTLIFFVPGLVLLFWRKLGDGRTFIFFWVLIWFLPISVLGGKFIRYFTVSEPLLLITSAIGFCFVTGWLGRRLAATQMLRTALQLVLFAGFVTLPVLDSLAWAPHYRLFTNSLGGGAAMAGKNFPHDEFYDGSTRDVLLSISADARPGAMVACETPGLFAYYADRIGRTDLTFISLSDKTKVIGLQDGDFVVLTQGRRYFSNTAYWQALAASMQASRQTYLGGHLSSDIYRLDGSTLPLVEDIARK